MSDIPNDDREILRFIAVSVEEMRETIATKADLEEIRQTMATKLDVHEIRGDLEQVHLRLDGIEKAISARMGQVEADLSRIRSAVYLLAKDRPEVLRLLGHE